MTSKPGVFKEIYLGEKIQLKLWYGKHNSINLKLKKCLISLNLIKVAELNKVITRHRGDITLIQTLNKIMIENVDDYVDSVPSL